MGMVWNKVNKVGSTFKPNNSPLEVGNNIITNDKDKAKVFKDYFASAFQSIDNLNQQEEQQLELQLNQAITDNNEQYNCMFTMSDLTKVISTLKSNSPGDDEIHNAMIKKLPLPYIEYMLNMFNKVWMTGNIPSDWKVGLLIPIHKLGKSPRLAESYRPITLLSCIGKTFEKMVVNRLYWYLENNNTFSASQSGFRHRLNTTDQIARLEKVIRDTYLGKEVCITVFIDLKGAYDKVHHAILLEKLRNKGVKGRLLNYYKNFLSGRTFKIIHNGEKTTESQVKIGVPQGASSSPILFNVHVSDIPETNGVIKTEYADDIAFIACGKTVREARLKIQSALDSFYAFTKTSKLEINYQKTVGMVFTRNNIVLEPININGYNIDYVNEFKFLGVVLDGPYLNWQKHINQVKTGCMSRLNVLKAVSHKDWGADKIMLIRLYKALILTKINYGREFYSTASKTALHALDTIQSAALRIAVGARQTSPILSLEVECGIMPLELQNNKVLLDYYNRFRHLPDNLQLVRELSDDIDHQMDRQWTSSTHPPLMVRAHKLRRQMQINEFDTYPVALVNIRPPWAVDTDIDSLLEDEPVNILPERIIQNLFATKMQQYIGYIKIYTDGSKNIQGSTGAAYVVPEYKVVEQWKLPSLSSILTAELHAIYKAIQWFADQGHNRAIILTDSLSGVEMLNNTMGRPSIYKHIIIQIIEQLKAQGKTCKISWIPSHKGIDGNELADREAKSSLNINVITIANVPKRDMSKSIKLQTRDQWQEHWDTQSNLTNVGNHLRRVRTTVNHWPWTSIPSNRKLESMLGRLRIGHCGLRAHMYRFGMADGPLCECNLPETVSHYVMDCQEHTAQRNALVTALNSRSIVLSMKNVLGGGAYKLQDQRFIVNQMWRYICTTNKDKII
jgi:ribonuclease HI